MKIHSVVRIGIALAAGVGLLQRGAARDANLRGFNPIQFVSEFATRTSIKLVPIAAGSFTMGSPASETGRQPDEGPQTRVTLTKDFFLGATDVTQAQWNGVMANNPSKFKGDELPVESLSWDEAIAFCRKLTERERAAGRLPAEWEFTLPTEAQWEYACRAGTTGEYAGDLDTMAWYANTSEGKTHPVGQKKANAWGLFDMHGNVWQWCLDWYGTYPGGAVTDPVSPATGRIHVHRGGGWTTGAVRCRSAFRHYFGTDVRFIHRVGLRLSLQSAR